jgi:hypothetical protein
MILQFTPDFENVLLYKCRVRDLTGVGFLRFIMEKDKVDKEGKWTRKKNKEELKPMKI